jgi:hypothetical protein
MTNNETYYDKEDKLIIKAGEHPNFEKIENEELESIGMIAYRDKTCPRANAILFLNGTRGSRHIWWSTAFLDDAERDVAIQNTVEKARRYRNVGRKPSTLNWTACKPECMGTRGL